MRLALVFALLAFPALAAPPPKPAIAAAPAEQPKPVPADAIVAVVNGEPITESDVENRARLFALSTGLTLDQEALTRLRPQITRQLIDDRLRMQEILRRRIIVPDIDVAHAIAEVEQRNNLPSGGLAAKLEGQGVAFRTLIAQLRVQLGWTRVLRQVLADRAAIGQSEIDEQERLLKAQEGQPQYHVREIFVAAEDPSRTSDAQKFADTVISQLRQGAPFGVVAAEFSQSQTALQGGDLGWVRADQLDPQVAALVAQIPPNAISNPIRVAGGFVIVTVPERRTVGNDLATVVSLRQAFLPFTSPLNPQAPTEQQRAALQRGQALSKSASSCDQIEAANKEAGAVRPADPGPVRIDHLNPQMQQLIGALKPGQASRAIVTPDGIMVVMVCSSEQKNLAATTREDIANQLLSERVELASRQLEQDLRRRALIDMKTAS